VESIKIADDFNVGCVVLESELGRFVALKFLSDDMAQDSQAYD